MSKKNKPSRRFPVVEEDGKIRPSIKNTLPRVTINDDTSVYSTVGVKEESFLYLAPEPADNTDDRIKIISQPMYPAE
jgi:hypothetical protein